MDLSNLSTRQGRDEGAGGMLEPLPIAEKRWDCVTMDFITCLPNSEGFGTIMVVVDHFSKYATFTATTAS